MNFSKLIGRLNIYTQKSSLTTYVYSYDFELIYTHPKFINSTCNPSAKFLKTSSKEKKVKNKNLL